MKKIHHPEHYTDLILGGFAAIESAAGKVDEDSHFSRVVRRIRRNLDWVEKYIDLRDTAIDAETDAELREELREKGFIVF